MRATPPALSRRAAVRQLALGPALAWLGGALAATPPPGKGLNGNELHRLAPAALDATLLRCRALGVRWMRFDFDWQYMQPAGPDNLRFADHDRVVQALRAAGIAVLGLIAYSPGWANGGAPSKFHPPTDAAAFARFAQALARRYAPAGVHAWEVWNEPNLAQFWQPSADPRAYARLLATASAALRQADPDAFIVSAGLAQPANGGGNMHALDFLEAMYQQGARPWCDAVGNHPYNAPALPSDPGPHNWLRMSVGRRSLRSIMAAHGDADKTVWITEYGAPTHGIDRYPIVISEARQAEMVRQAYRIAAEKPWAGPVFWYNLQDFCPPTDTSIGECHYGLFRHDGSEKPSAAAYRSA